MSIDSHPVVSVVVNKRKREDEVPTRSKRIKDTQDTSLKRKRDAEPNMETKRQRNGSISIAVPPTKVFQMARAYEQQQSQRGTRRRVPKSYKEDTSESDL